MTARSGTLAAVRLSVVKAPPAAHRMRSSGRARRSGSARGAAAPWPLLAPTTSRFETACFAPTKRHGAQPCGSARRSALASRTQASTSHPMSGPVPSRHLEPALPPASTTLARLAANARSGIIARSARRVVRTKSVQMVFRVTPVRLAHSLTLSKHSACRVHQVSTVRLESAHSVVTARPAPKTEQVAKRAQSTKWQDHRSSDASASSATTTRPMCVQLATRATLRQRLRRSHLRCASHVVNCHASKSAKATAD